MIEKIQQTFYGKLSLMQEDTLPMYEHCKLMTFLNYFYMVKLRLEDYLWHEEFDYIPSDGMGASMLDEICKDS